MLIMLNANAEEFVSDADVEILTIEAEELVQEAGALFDEQYKGKTTVDFSNNFQFWNGGPGYHAGGSGCIYIPEFGHVRPGFNAVREAVAYVITVDDDGYAIDEWPSSSECEQAVEDAEAASDLWESLRTQALKEHEEFVRQATDEAEKE